MQIWTNEIDLDKMELHYEFTNGFLLPAGRSWLINTPLLEIIDNQDKSIYEISIEGGKKIKLDYGQAHHLFLALFAMNESKVKILETTVVKSI